MTYGQTEERFEVAKTSNKKTLSAWWALIAVGSGLAAAILFGRFSSDGSAEIAGIMIGSLILCVRAFWGFRGTRWFVPLIAGWAMVHLAGLILFVLPLKLVASKGFIMLVWAEFFAFAGLLWLASRLWGGLPEE